MPKHMAKKKSFTHIPLTTELRIGIFILGILLVAVVAYVLAGNSVFDLMTGAPGVQIAPITSPVISVTNPVINSAPGAILRPTSKKEIVRGDTSKKQLIFTFDGGDGDQSTDGILAALAKHHVKGTFFLTGKFIETHTASVRKIVAGGHEIFNHTYSHQYLTSISDAKIATELQKMAQTLASTTGLSPKPYFRAPYGARDARVLADVSAQGYQSVYWTVDALDWKEPKGYTNADARTRILAHVAPGNIYLMHLGDTITGAILDDVFTILEARGYKMVSLTQGL